MDKKKKRQDTLPILKKLGPGLITGAADDDPSGIATYSQAGSQFGYGLLWSLLLTTPLMIGIQIVSARIGRVTGHGLAANIREHFPRPVLYFTVSLLVIANTINIAADLGALLDFFGIDAIKALLWAAVVNGVVSVPIMVVTMLLGGKAEVMGHFVVKRRLKALGWIAALIMAAAVVTMFVLM